MITGYPEFGRLLNRAADGVLLQLAGIHPRRILGTKLSRSTLQPMENYDDIDDSWSSVLKIIDLRRTSTVWEDGWPGNWNDPDMLIMGTSVCRWTRREVQMGMWCLLAAPHHVQRTRKMRPEFQV